MIASRAENEVISCAADVFGEFGAGNGDFFRAECGADEFGAGNGDFFRAELCSGAFRADVAVDSCAECGADEFGAGNGNFFRAEGGADEFRADVAADSRAGGMALAMQEPHKLQELQVPGNGADQLICE